MVLAELVEAQLKNYRNDFLEAINNDDIATIKNLLDSGINPDNVEYEDGNKALHIAAKKGNKKLVNLLVKHGANIDSRSKAGYTPLHIAAQFGNLELVKFLLSCGANIRSKTNKRETPVKIALRNDQSRVATFIIELQLKSLFNLN